MTWNGRRAAVSLTFDDGLPVQIEHALPEMDARGIHGTFFLIQNSPYSAFNRDVWRSAAERGHEIGAHSVNHCKAADLSDEQNRAEVRDCKDFIQKQVEAKVTSYCYPFTDAPAVLQDEARKHYKQARGGRVARPNKFITHGDGVNLYNLPCFHVNGGCVDQVQIWADAALERKAWFILMFHGIGPDEQQWDNVTTRPFCDMLDELQRRDIWIATLQEAAECYRGGCV